MDRADPNWVELTEHNLLVAGLVAVTRQIVGCRKQGRHGADNRKLGYQFNHEGCNGEMAFAKHQGLYWDGAHGNFKAKDVGNYQVRTRTEADYDLIVYPSDADNDVFVLVLSHLAPWYYMAGWLRGRDAKTFPLKSFREGSLNHFVPQNRLEPMNSLPR